MRSNPKQSGLQFRPAMLLLAAVVALGLGLSGCNQGEAPVEPQDTPDETTNDTNTGADPATPQEDPSPPVEDDAPAVGAEIPPVAPAEPAEADDAVAIQVNDQVMTFAEFEKELQGQMERLEQQLGGMQASPEMAPQLARIRDGMKQQLVDQIVTRMLLEDYLEQSEVEVSEEEIEQQWNEIVAQFPDAGALEQVLKEEGVTAAEAREQVARQVKLDKLMEQELGETEVTDAEAQAFYDMQPEEFAQPTQVRARHILLKQEEGTEEAVQSLLKRIEDGEDFAALAKEHSECPSSEQGGDLGFFGEDQMVEPFARQAFSMKPGEISPPVETEFGVHIIKVEERREAGKTEYAEVKDAIKEHLGRQRAQVQHKEFLDRLRDEAEVTVNVEVPASQPGLIPEAGEISP